MGATSEQLTKFKNDLVLTLELKADQDLRTTAVIINIK